MCNGSNVEVFLLKSHDEIIAARILSIEEHISHDIFACNSFKSRSNGATHYLMNWIFDYLRNRDIKYFDFSRIPIGKRDANGVYEFKKSTRGKTLQYNSEWMFCENRAIRHLYYIYNFLILRRDFY